jgi:hypothetical protein
MAGLFFCSSSICGECGSDFQEEVMVIAVAVSHPLDYLDPIVDALNKFGTQGVANSAEISF